MAFVRIGQFRALSDKADQMRSIYESEAIPAIRAARGNVSAALLQQREAQELFLAITVWDTEGDAVAYDRSGQATAMVDRIRFAFAGPPSLSTYEAFGIASRN